MMMKKALGLSLALLLAMAAVGPGMAEEASFVGIWELTGIIDASGTERSGEDIAHIVSALVLSGDGSWFMVLNEVSASGTWTVTDGRIVTEFSAGGVMEYTPSADGTLRSRDEGMEYIFTRVTLEEAQADGSGTERETTDDTVVQNMSDYMQGKMDFGSIRETDTQQRCHYFFDNADAGWIEQYVADLCAGGCFEIVDRYYEEGEENVWVEYALSYVGSGEVSGEKLEMTYKEGSYGDIVIDYATGGEEGLGFIRIVKGLTFGDLGLRAEAE